MQRLTPKDLEALVESSPEPCVSIYLPTIRGGKEMQQNRIRFRNLLRETERAAGVLEIGRELLERDELWAHPRDGLAVLLDRQDGERLVLRAPVRFEELALVSNRFHLKPLLGLLAGDLHFYLLDLNRHRVRLFEGSRDGMHEVASDGLPRDYRDVVGRDREEPRLQWHTGTGAPSSGGRDARFHGQGSGYDDVEGELERFVAELEPAVRTSLSIDGAPLVLAGLEPMLELFRQKNRYPHLAEVEIRRNVGDRDAKGLHDIAWPVVERLVDARRREAAKRVRERLGGSDASGDPVEIVAAADDGRIEELIVARAAHRWGTYDRSTRRVVLHENSEVGGCDLLDVAAVRTFATGGSVLVVSPEEVPGAPETVVAARFRYPGMPARTE